MAKFRTRLILVIPLLILLVSLSHLFFFLQISNKILKLEQVNSFRSLVIITGLSITALAIIAAVVVSIFLVRGITKSIKELARATKVISKKDFAHRIKMHTYAELEELISSFNDMAQQLMHYKEETKKHSQNLEKIAREKDRDLSFIYTIGREISSTLDFDEVLDTIVKRTQEVLGLKICTILLVDTISKEYLEPIRAEGINLKKIDKEVIERGQGISGWVWEKKEAVLVKDIDQDSRFVGRKSERYYTGSIISVPLEAEGKIIGLINANNKVNGEPFNGADLLLLKEIATESAIAIENALLYKSLKEVYVHTISALAGALEAKDRYTRSHSENVTKYAVAIAQEMGLPSSEIEIIRQACKLHDLGKIGIHDYILTKPTKLSAEEWEEIKLHALRGAQILQPINFLNEVADLIRQHHERYDGKGYPANLVGKNIHLGARIMAVADAFDAMISERPYRQALSLSQAKEELEVNSGTQFDPDAVKTFLKLLQDNPDIIQHK